MLYGRHAAPCHAERCSVCVAVPCAGNTPVGQVDAQQYFALLFERGRLKQRSQQTWARSQEDDRKRISSLQKVGQCVFADNTDGMLVLHCCSGHLEALCVLWLGAQEVMRAVQQLGLSCVLEYSDMEFSVDLALPRHRIAIEVIPASLSQF